VKVSGVKSHTWRTKSWSCVIVDECRTECRSKQRSTSSQLEINSWYCTIRRHTTHLI